MGIVIIMEDWIKDNNVTELVALLGIVATLVSGGMGMFATFHQSKMESTTTVAQSIVKARPAINGAYEPYNSSQVVLSPCKIDTAKLNNKSLPYIENVSQNVAENVQIRVTYKEHIKGKNVLSYYIRLASVTPHQKIFINNTINPNYHLFSIETQCDSTQGEVIRTNMDSHNEAGEYGFITSDCNVPWNTEVIVYDKKGIIDKVKKFDESGTTEYRTSRGVFDKPIRKLLIYNP